jgi:hypothetical protein
MQQVDGFLALEAKRAARRAERVEVACECRVGVLLDSAVQERWVLEMLRAALRVPGARLVAIALGSGHSPNSVAARLHRLVGRVDERLRCRGEELLAPVDVGAEFLGVPRVEVGLVGGNAWSLDEAGSAALWRVGADVWLCFCAAAPRRPLPRVAHYGLWGLEIGVGVPASDRWAGAAEVAAASPLTLARVVDYSEQGTALYEGVGATIRNSAGRNRVTALRRALGFLSRSLAAATRDGVRGSPARLPPQYPVRPAPTLSGVAQLTWRVAAKVAANRWQAVGWRRQWQIGYAFTDGATIDVAELRYLVPPKDRLWADPFALEHGGRHFIFFEDYGYRAPRGRIMAVEVNERGSPGEPQVVLERPYHLSYPFVFGWRGHLYMLPETAENGTVELYRCEEFPSTWRLERVLLRDVRAYDATLWQQGEGWWMFVSVAPKGTDGNDELHLYSSATPLGPWAKHPRNPVVVDTRSARPAGPLFVRDGVLYRPSQDCSVAYGHSISINRVDVLDGQRYAESQGARIEAGWRRDVLRVHTVGASGRLRVLDLLVRRRR